MVEDGSMNLIVPNGCLYFDGNLDCLSSNSCPSEIVESMSKPFSLSMWLKHNGLGVAWDRAIEISYDTNDWIQILNPGDSTIQAEVHDAGIEKRVSFDAASNTWYHVVATWDGAGVLKFYMNGDQQSGSGTDGAGPGADAAYTVIGNRSDVVASRAWSGCIYDVKFYDKALDQNEVTKDYYGIIMKDNLVHR